MNEPWFNPSYAWIAPTVLGCSCGVFGSIAGALIPRGIGKTFVVASYWSLLGVSALMLLAGLAAIAVGQPYGVWYGLVLGGGIGCGVLAANYMGIARGLQHAEQRRMQARDLA